MKLSPFPTTKATSIFPQLNHTAYWSCEITPYVRTYAIDHSPTHPSHRIFTHSVAITTPSAQKGMIVPKESVYRCVMVAGKGGGRQRVYFCDQKGCSASICWVKQATFSWRLTHLDRPHVNCGGATSSASIRGMNDVIENTFLNDNTVSGPKLQAAVSLRSIQRAKQKLVDTRDAPQASLMSKLRPYLRELEKHSAGTVTDVQVRLFYPCVCVRQINRSAPKRKTPQKTRLPIRSVVYVPQPHVSNSRIMSVVYAS